VGYELDSLLTDQPSNKELDMSDAATTTADAQYLEDLADYRAVKYGRDIDFDLSSQIKEELENEIELDEEDLEQLEHDAYDAVAAYQASLDDCEQHRIPSNYVANNVASDCDLDNEIPF
jgi:hypothetical protein